MDVTILNFELFRYQLLPMSIRGLFENGENVEKIRETKNAVFRESLSHEDLFNADAKISHQVVFDKGDWFVFKLASNKSIELAPVPFTHKTLNDWPNVSVIVNNRPDIQVIAISKNRKAFWSSNSVVGILLEALSSRLAEKHLTVQIEAISEQRYFWELVAQNRGKILSVNFELISPNMANISNTLELDLKKLNQDTNSHRTALQLNAAEGAALEIQSDNAMVNSIVDYSERGGGNISFRVRGLRNKVKTSDSTRTFQMDDMTVDNLTAEQAEAFLLPFFTEV